MDHACVQHYHRHGPGRRCHSHDGDFQKYFSYKMVLKCGIPTVTLLGNREDWAQLVTKLDKIPRLEKEPANLLRFCDQY